MPEADAVKDSAPKVVPILSWKAPEYQRHEKGKTWFRVAGTLVLLLVIYFVLTNSPAAAIAFILVAGLYYLVHQSELRELTVEINDIGIKVGTSQYSYSKLQSFWIIYDPPQVTTLNILTAGKIPRHIQIQLADQDPALVRQYLRQQIPEVEGRSEGLWDVIARTFRL